MKKRDMNFKQHDGKLMILKEDVMFKFNMYLIFFDNKKPLLELKSESWIFIHFQFIYFLETLSISEWSR